ncbi:MAG TPA: alpha/beta hydrolase family protein [Thermoleophilaceae bacterium]|nr:alpha/beta hydrolase family protein [Thermoleophilaceae bacterium]
MARALLLAVVLALLPATTANAAKLVTLEAPSRHVDPKTASFGGEGPHELKVNVLLPDGYTPGRRYPLLYLMHGAGESHRSWANPAKGDVRRTLDGLDAIVAMPEGGLGYYTNWWNGGERSDPAWERYHLDRVIPLLERRFRIRRARRWHAIAGFSMAGFGSSFLATQRPGYFGTVVPMSGLVSIRRAEVQQGLSAISGVPYEEVWGPWDGFYAEGHDPLTLAPNLRHTKVILRTGNGVPRPGVPADEQALASGALEAYLFTQNEEFAAALRTAGVDVDYRSHEGVHDWPYWREDIAEAREIGLFRRVAASPRRWVYSTVAERGEAWRFRYRFDSAPAEVIEFERRGSTLLGRGSGEVVLRDRSGCRMRLELPFERELPCVRP